MCYYNKDVIAGSGLCWFSNTMMLGLKLACLLFYPHAHKVAAALPGIRSCILVRKQSSPGRFSYQGGKPSSLTSH